MLGMLDTNFNSQHFEKILFLSFQDTGLDISCKLSVGLMQRTQFARNVNKIFFFFFFFFCGVVGGGGGGGEEVERER